jgi:hypothetical protein
MAFANVFVYHEGHEVEVRTTRRFLGVALRPFLVEISAPATDVIPVTLACEHGYNFLSGIVPKLKQTVR